METDRQIIKSRRGGGRGASTRGEVKERTGRKGGAHLLENSAQPLRLPLSIPGSARVSLIQMVEGVVGR